MVFLEEKDKMVGCASIYNMCNYNIHYNKLSEKYILFKKEKISALNHLDYTWLVGCKQQEKIISYMSSFPFGIIYHQTLNRNKQNNIIKFIFYFLLYRKNNNQPFNLIDGYDNDKLLLDLDAEEILEIFIHHYLPGIDIPLISETNIIEVNNDNYVYNLFKYSNNFNYYYFINEMKCLKNTPVYFRLQVTNNIHVTFDNVSTITIKMYNILLNQPYQIKEYKFSNIVNQMVYIDDINTNSFYLVIEVLCNDTIDNNFIFSIKNIE